MYLHADQTNAYVSEGILRLRCIFRRIEHALWVIYRWGTNAEVWPRLRNFAFGDTSISFDPLLEHTQMKMWGYRTFAYFSCGNNGCQFPKWPPLVLILVVQVLDHLESWFWWLIVHFQGCRMQCYYLQHASNWPTTYIWHSGNTIIIQTITIFMILTE